MFAIFLACLLYLMGALTLKNFALAYVIIYIVAVVLKVIQGLISPKDKTNE